MFKAVIFDRDGVLIDSEGVNIESVSQAFKQFGYTLSEEDKQAIIGRHSDDSISEIIERNNLSLKFIDIRGVQHEKYGELFEDGNKLMPNVEETLRELKGRGIALAVATNSGKKGTESFLKEYSLDDSFSILITKEDVTRRKPDPEIYLLSKKRLGIPGEEILVVEDTSLGIESAKRAGLKCVAVPNEYTKHQDFSDADYIVDSLKKVLDVVFK